MFRKNEKDAIKTIIIKDEITKCETIEELNQKIHGLLLSRPEQWSAKVNQIRQDNGYTKTAFAKHCGVSRVTVDKWCKGAIPKNRETFLRIGLAANYDHDGMNQFLQRYGRYPALYAKSLEDCICIFVLNNYCAAERMDKYYYILNKIKDKIIQHDSNESEDESTVLFEEKLLNVQNEEELNDFIEKNINVFRSAYHGFNSYVIRYIYNNNILEKYMKDEKNPDKKILNKLQEGFAWSSSLRQCVSAIRQDKWYPTRNKVISLGMHLCMDQNTIDKMLKYAHMEPLCAKNIGESILIFILDDVKKMIEQNSDEFVLDDLCAYALDIFSNPIFAEIKAEIEVFISELTEVDYEVEAYE